MKKYPSPSPSSIRKFILITLSHAENRGVSKEEIQRRVTDAFVCRSVIVAQEMHQGETEKHPPLGFHFHVAVFNQSASKNNATSVIRKLFPEFEGRQCQVTFHKSFVTMCSYVSKEDTLPLVWGEYSLKDILRFAQNARNKDKSNKVTPLEILQQLRECSQWLDVYNKPDLANLLLLRHNNFKKVHADLQVIKMQQASFAERIISYLDNKKGSPQEYTLEQLQEKYILLDWIACQLAFNRPIKTKQLFLYGKPSTQKTLIFHFLAKALRIYFASSRINDFTGADDYYDLWIFDEFFSNEAIDNGQNDTNQENILLKVLDGQECRLDSKYREVFNKKINVPIIMVANNMPWKVKTPGPMRERFLRLRFHSQIDNLQEERIIATLWGCVFRRINQQLALFPRNDCFIKYNNANALIKASSHRDLLQVFFPQNDYEECLGIIESSTREEPLSQYKKKNFKHYPFLNLYLQKPSLLFLQAFNQLSLIKFALIPLMKSEAHLHTIPVFKKQEEGATFQVFRPEDDEHLLIWPIYASYVHDEQTEKSRQSQRISDLPVKINLDSDFSLLQWKAEARTDMNKPTSFPQGMWKLNLGVPGTDNNGNWDEDD